MGRFWIENELVDKYLDKISGNELKVLLKITRHYNKNGTCYPSIRKMEKDINLHHDTITACLKQLQLLGFLEQLAIKERCKLRYSFSKTARFFLTDSQNLLGKPDSKEDIIKEDIKEGKNFFYKGREQMEGAKNNALKKANSVAFNKLYGNAS